MQGKNLEFSLTVPRKTTPPDWRDGRVTAVAQTHRLGKSNRNREKQAPGSNQEGEG